MTVAFDIPQSGALPPVHIGRGIGTAPALPLVLTCVGEIEHTEDDPALGTWWQQRTLMICRCRSIADAIAFAGLAAARGDFARDDAGGGFTPQLFVILDSDRRLVLAGEVSCLKICWCEPVSGDTEARGIVREASRIRAEASYETGCDNFGAAKDLRRKAGVLEGRLVDPFWRDEVRRVLREVVQ